MRKVEVGKTTKFLVEESRLFGFAKRDTRDIRRKRDFYSFTRAFLLLTIPSIQRIFNASFNASALVELIAKVTATGQKRSLA